MTRLDGWMVAALLGIGCGAKDVSLGDTEDGSGDAEASSDAGSEESGASESGDPGDSPYAACDGNPHFPEGCDGGACAAAGLATQIYDRWQVRFLAVHGIDQAYFDAHIEIATVAIQGDFWRVDYVYVVDWVRSRNSTSADIAALGDTPSDAAIDEALALGLDESEQQDISDVVEQAEVESAVAECTAQLALSDVEIDYCGIRFENVTGLLFVQAKGVIDLEANRCGIANVDVDTGDLMACYEDACSMS